MVPGFVRRLQDSCPDRAKILAAAIRAERALNEPAGPCLKRVFEAIGASLRVRVDNILRAIDLNFANASAPEADCSFSQNSISETRTIHFSKALADAHNYFHSCALSILSVSRKTPCGIEGRHRPIQKSNSAQLGRRDERQICRSSLCID